jgi:hypothetical protein
MTDTVDEIQVRPKIVAEDINFHYGNFQALTSVRDVESRLFCDALIE